MDPNLIDALLERDKDCKEYTPDCDCDIDEKFNKEIEKRFTDLMSRTKDTSINEYSRKVTDYEMMSSICKSLKIQQLKLLHRHIIDVADELYRLSDELDMSDNEECNCKVSIIEALKELDHVAEYLTKRTLGDANETSK